MYCNWIKMTVIQLLALCCCLKMFAFKKNLLGTRDNLAFVYTNKER